MEHLQKAVEAGLSTICHQHHRALAYAQGLKTSKSRTELAKQLTAISKEGDSVEVFRTHPEWFTAKYYEERGLEQEKIYRFTPQPPGPFSFDASQVLERCLGPGTWALWLKNGNIISSDAFAYLRQIQSMIDHEFGMYRHHLSSQYRDSRRGWLKNMYHSLLQQLLRQDPFWYAVNAAARPDKQWRLISFPYYTKDTDLGESLGFKHLDINIMKYTTGNVNQNALISSSVAFDDEHEDNCTTVVLGFHQHIREWANRLLERKDLEKSFTGHSTNCNQIYRPQDQRDFGNHTPTPCPAFGIRITRPDIIHGSTSGSTRRRRSAFAWFSGIGDDHSTLDGTGSMTWEQVASCHRDHSIPQHEPSGQQLRHAQRNYNQFSATVVLESTSALGDALLGQRKWTDPAVHKDRNILLGDNDANAVQFVQEVRARLVKAYIRAYDIMVEAEKEYYGESSYFAQL